MADDLERFWLGSRLGGELVCDFDGRGPRRSRVLERIGPVYPTGSPWLVAVDPPMQLRGHGPAGWSEVVVKGRRTELIEQGPAGLRLKGGRRWWDVWVKAMVEPDVGPYVEAEAAAERDLLPAWPDYKAARSTL